LSLKRIFYAGFIATIITFLYSYLTDGYLFSWIYLIVPGAAIWKDFAGIWYLWSILVIFIVSIIYAFIYALIEESVPGIRFSKGFFFGLMLWLVGVLPFALDTIVSTKLNVFIPIYLLFNGLVRSILTGVVFAGMLTEKK